MLRLTGKRLLTPRNLAVLALFPNLVAVILLSVLMIKNVNGAVELSDVRDKCMTAVDQLRQGNQILATSASYYVAIGDRVYLDAYFRELGVKHHRDNAFALVKGLGHLQVVDQMHAFMENHMDIERVEFRAMRLMAESQGIAQAEMPEKLQALKLSPAEAALPPAEKRARALRMLYDTAYLDRQKKIWNALDIALIQLSNDEFSAVQARRRTFTYESLAIAVLAASMLLVCTFLVFVNRQAKEINVPPLEVMGGKNG